MSMIPREALDVLVTEFAPEAIGLALLGSHARGTAGMVSDVDLVRFVDTLPARPEARYTLFIRDERLVSLSNTTLAEKQDEMRDPWIAILAVPGLRQMKILSDPTGEVTGLQQAALDFRWEDLGDAPLETASYQTMGYAEEVHKILTGLQRKDDSAALYGAYGLVLGLSRIVLVAKGVLVESENRIFEAAQEAGGSGWARSFRMAAGFERWPGGRPEVPTRAIAATDLYVQTVRMLMPVLRPEHRTVINHTLQAIAVNTPYEP